MRSRHMEGGPLPKERKKESGGPEQATVVGALPELSEKEECQACQLNYESKQSRTHAIQVFVS